MSAATIVEDAEDEAAALVDAYLAAAGALHEEQHNSTIVL